MTAKCIRVNTAVLLKHKSFFGMAMNHCLF